MPNVTRRSSDHSCSYRVQRRIRALATSLLITGALLGAAASVSAQELPTAVPEEMGMSSTRLDRLTRALQSYVDTNRIPGAVAMVLRNGASSTIKL